MSRKGNHPRVLLATGIFFPDIGGPATHVRHIAERLHAQGWDLTVLAFGDHDGAEPYRVIRISRKRGRLISWIAYAYSVFRESLRHDALYAFDLTTAGLPSAVMARVFGKPFLLRIGGDPIWERIVEKGKRALPMREYYERRLFLRDRPLLYRVLRFVVRSADRIVTYSDFIRDIYVDHYAADPGRISIIPNPFVKHDPLPQETGTFTYLFAGRFVSYKNLPRVIRAFSAIAARHSHARLLLIGRGPEEALLMDSARALGDRISIRGAVDQKTLVGYIERASVVLAPAFTEFNPNFVLEALSYGRPALISADNGLSVRLPDELTLDPMSDASVEAAMERIIAPDAYRRACEFIESLPEGRSWEALVDLHMSLISDTIRP